MPLIKLASGDVWQLRLNSIANDAVIRQSHSALCIIDG